MLGNFNEILNAAVKHGGRKIAVAGAEGAAVLTALKIAKEKGIAEPVLVGNQKKIEKIAQDVNFDISGVLICNKEDETDAAEKAVEIVDNGEASALMKGKVSTPVLLKAVLNKKYNLRTGRLLSHVTLLELPEYHKLMIISDGGMVIYPTLEQKKEIIKNSIEVIHKLGIDRPKIAVLAAIEKVNPGMVETEDAQALAEMAKTGEFGDVILEGPLAMDVAMSREAAEIKGISSKVSGDPDILIVPNIACGNILAKSLIYLAKARIGGVIAGARKPVILLSRADNAETKLNSIALGVASS
ncbi:bifunctional enoyl-CoA hydratase/phosphate acetyltransferase [bacterium]|nr:bifunctional enoyl-CoA hydratase/phosphate acetyltransferase [bacterium]